ncbi:hypothetical protein BaRGS_00017579 [Batillaria attramentaria]|uniref:Uncharacterized protein n=1 Tax=Batillaria attramentaria TaxID=370345 RepID=A0ABD0KWL5_9CAEN
MAPTSSSLTLQTLLAITLATGTRGFGLSKQTAPERQADRVSQSIGLYRRLAENPTPDAILVLLCHGAGAAEGVKDCIGVPSIE